MVRLRSALSMLIYISSVFSSAASFAEPWKQNTDLLRYAESYERGDLVTNRGGITFSSEGLGTWHASDISGVSRHGTSHGAPHTLPLLPPVVGDGGRIPNLDIPHGAGEDGGGTPSTQSRTLAEPPSWMFLAIAVLFAGFGRERRSVAG